MFIKLNKCRHGISCQELRIKLLELGDVKGTQARFSIKNPAFLSFHALLFLLQMTEVVYVS